MAGLVRYARWAMLGCLALGAPLSWLARERPAMAAACLGALATSRAVPALVRRRGRSFSAHLELLWLAPFVACWGLGEGWGLFVRVRWWDDWTHALGGAAVFALGWALGPRRRGRVALGLVLALAAGALWELGEFASDGLLRTATQGGNSDSMADLLFDLLGGLGAAAGALALDAARRRRAGGRAGPANLHAAQSRV